jgi:tetratricopeptide (TPR) repeat protein
VLTVRASLALKSLRLGQLLGSMRSSPNEPREWEGMELFLRNHVSSGDPRLERVYGNFSANLSAIIGMGWRAGAKVVVASIPVNLKDCPPFASAHRVGLTTADLQKWEERFARGRQAESDHRYPEALAAYQEASQIDPDFAELIFRRAGCELLLGQTVQAKADFSLARDLDALRFRADSHINAIVRQAASTGKVPLVDAEQEFALHSTGGVPGDEQFYDHVHLNFSGNYNVATLLAARVEQELFPAANSAGSFLAGDEVARELAFTDFDRRRVGEEMQLRLSAAQSMLERALQLSSNGSLLP